MITFAEKKETHIAATGGYEQFTEVYDKGGYAVGLELKHYVRNRIFVMANFRAGVNDGNQLIRYYDVNLHYLNFDLSNSIRDYSIAIGFGGDLFRRERHKIYLQGAVGLGSSERWSDKIEVRDHSYPYYIVTQQQQITSYSINSSAGYDFRICHNVWLGAAYTGHKVGGKYNNIYEMKLIWGW